MDEFNKKEKKEYIMKKQSHILLLTAILAVSILGTGLVATATNTEDSYTDVSMIDFYGFTFKEFSLEIDISNYKIPDDVETFSNNLNIFPILTKVVMCDCGFTNEDMEYLMEQHPDIKFVWRLHFANKWSCRTDAIAFSTLQPKNYTTTMDSNDAAQFKYCTEMQCLDIGHNRVTDISFLQYMPELRILILHANYDRINGGKLRDISYLKYCPKLTYLEIFKSDISDISVFQYLPKLKDVYASTTKISDITFLMDLPDLERLYIQDTKISEADYFKLKERYPDAQIKYYGNESVWDNGWRNSPKYWGLLRTIRSNEVDPMFEPNE